jgi:hypothetical protein
MLKRLTQSALALTLVLGVVAVTMQDAEAHRRRGGVGAGIVIGTILGLGIAGAYAGPRYYEGPACYPGPRQCGYVGRRCWVNSYGERICRGGEYRCWRAEICD